MNPQHLLKRVEELAKMVEQLKARVEALENKPRLGRPPKNEAD